MIIKLYTNGIDQRAIAQIAKILRSGGIAILPTDTLYAFACSALHTRAIEQICALKGIDPRKKHLSIHCADIADASQYAKINNEQYKLLRQLTPGPYTFILPATTGLPKIYMNRKEVGIRIADNDCLQAIIHELGAPILSSSLHMTNDEEESRTDITLIAEHYETRVDCLVDAGHGSPHHSTILDLTTDTPTLLRLGAGAWSE